MFVKSILRPQQPTSVLTAWCPNFSANNLAVTIVGSDLDGCLVGMHHLLISRVKVGRNKSQREAGVVYLIASQSLRNFDHMKK
jgi:hypothetical protein